MFVRSLLAGAVVAASVAVSGPATAGHDLCTAVEADGCHYCSYEGSLYASPPSSCYAGYSGYYWASCSLWVVNVCLTGAID